MRKLLCVMLITCVTALLSISSRKKTPNINSAIKNIEALYLANLQSLDSFLKAYPSYFYDSSHSSRQQKFEEFAYYLKRASGGLIYFNPELYYKKLVGPFQFEMHDHRKGFFKPLPMHWLMTGPIGNEPDSNLKKFGPDYHLLAKEFIIEATSHFRNTLAEFKPNDHFKKMDPSTVFDFLRTDIFRISTVDVANADLVVEDVGLPSLKGVIDSWIEYVNAVVATLPSSESLLIDNWTLLSTSMRNYLVDKDYKTLNRAIFIRNYLIPASLLLRKVQFAFEIPDRQKWSAIRPSAAHMYDNNIFNVDYFAPNKDAFYTPERAKLGELLFFDPILSDNNERACASCHKPEKAFTDGEPKATAFEKVKVLGRNTPTVINSGFQKQLFWDLRANSLEDQLDSVVNNVDELHSSFDRVIDRINSSPEYVKMFRSAFPSTKKNGIQRQDVKNAIGVYERTVNGLNSRFDQYMRGDDTKLTDSEINGFNLYMGKARCGTCHFAPLFNGALPPYYDITDHHSLGVPVKDTMEKYSIDSDAGLYKRTNNPLVKFSFKTPTVRNSALTAPYMHNGVYKTLEQVINFYDHAAGDKFLRDYRSDKDSDMKGLPFFTIIPIELKLTDSEKKDLVAFIHALNDTSANATPKRLPELKGKYASINDRKIGGVY